MRCGAISDIVLQRRLVVQGLFIWVQPRWKDCHWLCLWDQDR